MSNYRNESQLFSRRSFVAGAMQFGFFGLLGWRLYYLQIQRADEYATLAEENRVSVRLIAPPRGRILDRHSHVIAQNEQDYQLVLISEEAGDAPAVLQRLSFILDLSPAKRRRILRRLERTPDFIPVTIANNLDWDDFSHINLEMPFLPGVTPRVGRKRAYPYGESLAHIIGYVGAPTRDDIEENGQVVANQVGRSGIERRFEHILRGNAGVRQVEVNAYGRIVRELARQEGLSGRDITLTIDAQLQTQVLKHLEGHSAAAVVMDVKTGEILVLASSPSFDPNHLSHGIDAKNWQKLTSDIYNPLLNKAVRGVYAPGSTFKMIVALAGLKLGAITADETINCSGTYQLEREIFHCWEIDGHRDIDVETALAQSCDAFFYVLAQRIGIKPIAAMARRFGLGALTQIELNGEKAGIVPDHDWKRANFETGWRLGETVITGIGQGYLLTTPLQLAMMTARLASSISGGVARAVRPHLVRAIDGRLLPFSQFETLDISSEHLALIHRGLYRAINRPEGTAYGASLYVRGKFMAGKTGTVQVRRISLAEREAGIADNQDLEWNLRDHAIFVGYAPHDNPRYAVSVLVEHGGSGTLVAAPIARDILMPLLLHGHDRDR